MEVVQKYVPPARLPSTETPASIWPPAFFKQPVS